MTEHKTLEITEDYTSVTGIPVVSRMVYEPYRGSYDTMPYYEDTIRLTGLDGKEFQADFSAWDDFSMWIVYCE